MGTTAPYPIAEYCMHPVQSDWGLLVLYYFQDHILSQRSSDICQMVIHTLHTGDVKAETQGSTLFC